VPKTISATDAARNFRAVLNDVEGNGVTFRIERHGQPIAELAPVGSRVRRFTGRDLVELLQQLPKLDSDFSSDLVAIHAEGNMPVRDPWE
jgi:antitoxin (DNA-binding transcriptional repressor) of toxin-antitoxin stability system